MLYSIENREDLEKLEELDSLKNQVEKVQLHDKLGKQNSQDNIKKVFEPLSETIKNTSETKTLMLISEENNQAIENICDKHLEILNGRGIIAIHFFVLYLKSLIQKKIANST